MPHLDTLVFFMAAALALNVTPGPDMLYVIARSTGEGRAEGVRSALGIALGLLFNASGTIVNLAVALAASRATGWLRANQTTAIWLHRTTGVVFVGLGMRLALARDR